MECERVVVYFAQGQRKNKTLKISAERISLQIHRVFGLKYSKSFKSIYVTLVDQKFMNFRTAYDSIHLERLQSAEKIVI